MKPALCVLLIFLVMMGIHLCRNKCRKIIRLEVYKRGAIRETAMAKYLNQFELHTLIAYLDIGEQVNWDCFILLVAKTGMRFSEALAITPADRN